MLPPLPCYSKACGGSIALPTRPLLPARARHPFVLHSDFADISDAEWGELERGLFVEDELGPGWGPVEPTNAGAESSSQDPTQTAGGHAAGYGAVDDHGPQRPDGAGGGRGYARGFAADEVLAGGAAAAASAYPPAPVSSDVVIIIDD